MVMDDIFKIYGDIEKYHEETKRLLSEIKTQEEYSLCDKIKACFKSRKSRTEKEILMIKLSKATDALDKALVQINIANDIIDFIDSEPI